jgi:hypothetical protein
MASPREHPKRRYASASTPASAALAAGSRGQLMRFFNKSLEPTDAGPNRVRTKYLQCLANLPVSPYLLLDPAGDGEPARFYRAFMQ